jgi:very-short-patch-repair endonuclease
MGQLHGEIDTYGPAGPFWGFYPKFLTPDDVEAVLGMLKEANQWANDLEDDVRDLCKQLNAQVDAFTLGVITRQNEPVRTYLDSLPRDIPLDLFTTVCSNDQKLRAEIASILDGIESMQKDGAAGKRRRSLGLSNFEGVGGADLQTVTELLDTLRNCGLNISKFSQAKDLCEGLAALRFCLEDLQDDLSDLLADRSIKGDRVAGQLDNVIDLATLIQEAPTNIDQRFFTIDWTEDGLARVHSLKQDLDQHRTLAEELRPRLRFDYLPTRESLIEAMLVFREGDAWFRFFQARWRKANAMHKSIGLRQNLTVAERLRDFEQLVQWMDLDLSVRNNPDWATILGFSGPDLSFNLELPLTVATWSLKSINVFSNVPGLSNSIHEISRTDLIRIKRDYVKIKSIIENASQVLECAPKFGIRLSSHFSDDRPVLDSISSLIEFCKNAQTALDQLVNWGETRVSPRAKLAEVVDAIRACIELQAMEQSLASNQRIGVLLGSAYKGLETDIGAIRKLHNIESNIKDMEIMKVVMAFICGGNPKAKFTQLDHLVTKINKAFTKVGAFEQAMLKYGEFNTEVWTGFSKNSDIVDFSSWFASRVETASGQSSLSLSNWAHYLGQRNAAIDLGLEPLCVAMEVGKLKAEMLPNAIRYSYYASVVRRAFSAVPNLSQFKGTTHESRIKRYRELDRQIIRTRGRRIAFEAHRRASPPSGISAARASQLTEMALVSHLIDHPRARVTIRSLMVRATKAIRALKPCFMMGPQAVAQYLAPGQIKFDVVVMDEASQLKPEEAIGAIARAKQLIVVGDPKQLPPTSFFSKNSISDDDDDQYVAVEAESILDVCKQKFASCRQLQFHYRSQHHSLIAFSNRHFYDESLIVTPAPFEAGDGLGVKAIHLPNAVYEGQLNVQEANAVVRSAIEQIHRHPEKSLLVVTLNIKQSDYIAELFEQQVQADKRIVEYRLKWEEAGEPLEFKNLENVQGEERDVVMISTTFGKSPGAEKPRQNFGPISRQGGWRRLNVLFTRARQELKLFTSLDPEDIAIGPDSPQGTIALRNYLQFVKTGHDTIPENSGALPDSDFEYFVIRRLQAIGYSVVPQLGVGKYRIDIAVVHPDIAGAYLAAIECDGESYHSAESARDRDRIRQEVLESLGWRGRIWRIWSTDWFRDAEAEFARLVDFLKLTRQTWNPSFVQANHWVISNGGAGETQSTLGRENVNLEIPTNPRDIVIQDRMRKAADAVDRKTGQVSESGQQELSFGNGDPSSAALLLVGEEDIEVGVGTIVRYIEHTMTGPIEGTIKIVAGPDHPEHGILSVARPFAQCFLEAVKGDEVLFHAGEVARKFTIADVRRM